MDNHMFLLISRIGEALQAYLHGVSIADDLGRHQRSHSDPGLVFREIEQEVEQERQLHTETIRSELKGLKKKRKLDGLHNPGLRPLCEQAEDHAPAKPPGLVDRGPVR